MTKAGKYLREYSGWNAMLNFSRIKKFPGHSNLSLHDVLSFLVLEIQRDSILTRASAISFNFFVSLFPSILVLFTLIPYLPIPSFQATMLTTLKNVLPNDVFGMLQETIHDIVTRHQGGLLSASLILAMYYSTRGVISIMTSFDKALPTFRRRKFLENLFVSFKITGLLFLLLVISILLFLGGELLIHTVMKILHIENSTSYFSLSVIRWITLLLIFYFSISLIYYYGPAMHKRWRFFTPGSTLATILSVLVSILFSFIINQFGQYNKLYGSLGTIVVLLLWIYYNSLSLLLGFELNASIEMNKHRVAEGLKQVKVV
ncbi:MAG: YihY/virulence factor BrkB family protein [Chitinophagales bacterium]|nr:YihY/virulence factor BrkB family protein [Chitinophagales bacterium]